MFIRIDSRPVLSAHDRRSCRCAGERGFTFRLTRNVRLVRSVRTPSGPRQETIVSLASYRTCCVRSVEGQQRLWRDVSSRLGSVKEPFDRREVMWKLAERLATDLGPGVLASVAQVADEKAVARWVGPDGRAWEAAAATPDVTRLSVFPSDLGALVEEAARVSALLQQVENGQLEPSEREVLLQQDLRPLAGPYVTQLREALSATTPEDRRLAAKLLVETRRDLAERRHARPRHLSAAMVVEARQKVASVALSDRRATPWRDRGRADEQRVRPRVGPIASEAATRAVLRLVAQQPPERIVALSLALEPTSQRAIGMRVYRRKSEGAAQRAVSRALGRFVEELKRTRQEAV